MEYQQSDYQSLPSKPGVYRFLDEKGQVLYVGKAVNLKSRVSSYFTQNHLGEKTELLVAKIKKIDIILVESEIESLLLEAFLIKKHKPFFNVKLADDKSYPFIRITINDLYPSITLARRNDDKKSIYYGPYPSISAVKLVLKTIRKVFPFQSTISHGKKICLYNHLKLCPCPPVFDSKHLRSEYKKNIKNIIRILEGDAKKIMKELERKRDKYSKNEEYEKALEIQKKIQALSIITQPIRKPFEYEQNPNLRMDIRQEELNALQSILQEHGLKIENLTRIECYDISNIQGKYATGSLVVLTNGEIDKSQYRRFKIINDGKVNDFAMIAEVIKRRIKHKEWLEPSLIIIDGGKGQVSAALNVLNSKNLFYPLIGLAKREETIIIPKQTTKKTANPSFTKNYEINKDEKNNYYELSLPKNSKALHLIMRIRDEAHRFAINYHRKLRSKYLLSKNNSKIIYDKSQLHKENKEKLQANHL